MELTEIERATMLRLAWYPPDREFLGEPQRPLCLGTWHAMALMGIRLLDEEVAMSPAEEYRQLAVYLWLHREPVEVIEASLWSGAWRAMLEVKVDETDPPLELLAEWREMRARLLGLLEATAIRIRPQPRSPHDKTPGEVVGPDAMGHHITVVMDATGKSEREVMWDLPLYQELVIYHGEMRKRGHWTYRPGKEVAESEFVGFGDAVFANLRSDGGGGDAA